MDHLTRHVPPRAPPRRARKHKRSDFLPRPLAPLLHSAAKHVLRVDEYNLEPPPIPLSCPPLAKLSTNASLQQNEGALPKQRH